MREVFLPELAVVLLAYVLYFALVLRPTGFLTANSLFVHAQLVMAFGTYRLLDPAVEADRVHSWVLLVTFLVYLTVSTVVMLNKPPALRSRGKWDPEPPKPEVYTPKVGVWFLIGLSAAIMVLYFQSVGYSALIEGLRNTASGDNSDVAGLRLESYAGSRYFAPGYVNQFKNALLPALVALVLTHWVATQQRHRLLAAGLIAVAVFGLVGTGQRGAFVTFAIVAVIYLYLIGGRQFTRGLWRLGLGALAVMMLATIALGRQEVGRDASWWDWVSSSLGGIFGRVSESQQVSSVAGFRYIYEQPIQWGSEWATSLVGLLPGSTGSDLSNRIFETLYGGFRGTSPPSIWGSAYHNLGWVGVVVLPAVLAVIIGFVSRAGSAPLCRNTMEMMGIAGVSVMLGFWVAGGPTTPINTGVVVFAVLWWVGRNHRTKKAATARERSRTRRAALTPRH